jgi:NAD(P)-dependent dehydrogenase (short-subunit alcohol dehydrogenase family)
VQASWIVQSDAASLPDTEALAERAKAEFGTLDALFVNAGITRFVPFEQMTEQVYDEPLAVNAKGPHFTAQKLRAGYPDDQRVRGQQSGPALPASWTGRCQMVALQKVTEDERSDGWFRSF